MDSLSVEISFDFIKKFDYFPTVYSTIAPDSGITL